MRGAGGGPGFDPTQFVDFADILGDFFGFGGESSRASRRNGEDLKADVTISFEEAAFGAEISVPDAALRALRGLPRPRRPGRRRSRDLRDVPRPGPRPVPPGLLRGRASVSRVRGLGPEDQGSLPGLPRRGARPPVAHADDRDPSGVDDGARLRLSGEGNSARPGGRPGDLYILISVSRHEIYRRDGNDVVLAWAVPFHLAAMGGSVTVPTLHGDATFDLPAGTAAGRVFTLKGKGVPRLDGRGKGDQHVLVTIRVPKKMTHAQKEAVEKLAAAFDGESGAPTKDEKGFFEGLRTFWVRRRGAPGGTRHGSVPPGFPRLMADAVRIEIPAALAAYTIERYGASAISGGLLCHRLAAELWRA